MSDRQMRLDRPSSHSQAEVAVIKPMVLAVYTDLYGQPAASTMLTNTLAGITSFVIDQAHVGLSHPLVHTTKDGTEHRIPAEDILNALAPVRDRNGE